MKAIFNKDFSNILFGNIFADVVFEQLFIFEYLFLMTGAKEIPVGREALFYLVFGIFILLPVARLFVLPILYSNMEKKSEHQFVQNFIYNLKHSFKFKVLALLISILHTLLMVILFKIFALISLKPDNIFSAILNLFKIDTDINILKNFVSIVFISIFFGLLGSYLVLYLYWFVKEKFSKKQI